MTEPDKYTIACVLKTGGVYDWNYVNRLADSIREHVTVPYRFICFTDDIDSKQPNARVDELMPLTKGWPGWWSKIEIFGPHRWSVQNIFFLDLDTVVVDNIDEIVAAKHNFTALDDFYYPGQLGSGVMAFKPRWFGNVIHDDFAEAADWVMRNTPHGDQAWIQSKLPSFETFQDRFPNAVVSYKRDCVRGNTVTIPEGAKIICFHGSPKPHELAYDNPVGKKWGT